MLNIKDIIKDECVNEDALMTLIKEYILYAADKYGIKKIPSTMDNIFDAGKVMERETGISFISIKTNNIRVFSSVLLDAFDFDTRFLINSETPEFNWLKSFGFTGTATLTMFPKGLFISRVHRENTLCGALPPYGVLGYSYLNQGRDEEMNTKITKEETKMEENKMFCLVKLLKATFRALEMDDMRVEYVVDGIKISSMRNARRALSPIAMMAFAEEVLLLRPIVSVNGGSIHMEINKNAMMDYSEFIPVLKSCLDVILNTRVLLTEVKCDASEVKASFNIDEAHVDPVLNALSAFSLGIFSLEVCDGDLTSWTEAQSRPTPLSDGHMLQYTDMAPQSPMRLFPSGLGQAWIPSQGQAPDFNFNPNHAVTPNYMGGKSITVTLPLEQFKL